MTTDVASALLEWGITAAPIHLERFTEPFTGMSLIGVGGIWYGTLTDAAASIRIAYDGALRAETPIRPTDKPNEYHFATHLPEEPATQRIQVRLKVGSSERILLEAAIEAIGQRGERSLGPEYGFVRRAVHALRSGKIFSPRLWKARLRRWWEKLVTLRLKVDRRLLGYRHPHRSAHQAFLDHTQLTNAECELRRALGEQFRYRPIISILMPIYNVSPRWLEKAIASVQGQFYDRWELCLADDCSTNPETLAFLDRLPNDSRIKLVRRTTNGRISAATNTAADVATGEFVAFMDNDDALAPDALFEIVKLLQDHPETDLIYSDEDKITEDDVRYDPHFKPEWSPELLLSYNYINHFTCMRKSLFDAVGRFRVGYDGSQDHDLLLRVTEQTEQIRRIPRILYHWRAVAGSTATAAEVKTYVHTSGRQALQDWLQRNQVPVSTYIPPIAERLKLPINLLTTNRDNDLRVGVIVFGDSAQNRLPDLKSRTDYPYAEWIASSVPPPRMKRDLWENLDCSAFLFLSADLLPENNDWLRRMVAYLALPGVGIVGSQIRSPNGRSVVHAGVVLGMHDGIAPANAFHGQPVDTVSYFFLAETARTVSAVSGLCLLTRKSTFTALDGFDTAHFGETLWDVDYCLRAADRLKQRTVYSGGAELRHCVHADDRNDRPSELAAFHSLHGRRRDPYHNPNCSERFPFVPVCDSPSDLLPMTAHPPLRLFVVSHNLNNAEGAPRYLFEIVEGLLNRGGVVAELFAPQDGKGRAYCERIRLPVHVGIWPESDRFIDGQWTPREYARWLRRFIDFLHRHKPDVLLVNTLPCFPIIEAAARCGVPSVWIIHESYSQEHLTRLFTPFAKARCEFAFRLASRIVPASHDTAALFQRINHRHNLHVIHNGIDPSDFDAYAQRISKEEAAAKIPGPANRKRIVSVGTVCERKGQHALIEAAARLGKHRRDFCIYLIGVRDHIPYAGYVRHLVQAYHVDDVVQLIGETDDVRPFLRAADIFACTSYMETFSRAILEAEIFGLPIVSTNCCGLSEQVWWKHSALNYPMGDFDALADRLEMLLSNDELRAEMGRQSRAAFATHLSYAEMLDRYEWLLRSAARHGPRSRLPIPIPLPTSSSGISSHRLRKRAA